MVNAPGSGTSSNPSLGDPDRHHKACQHPHPPASRELATCFEQGLALRDSGAWDAARAMFSRGLALDATRTGLWHNRAWCHVQLGDLAAAQAVERALLLGERGQLDEPTARQLADVLALAEQAQALFRQLWPALCLTPHAQALRELAQVLLVSRVCALRDQGLRPRLNSCPSSRRCHAWRPRPARCRASG